MPRDTLLGRKMGISLSAYDVLRIDLLYHRSQTVVNENKLR
jgi:hypothetical protein